MSGGKFDYAQYRICDIVDELTKFFHYQNNPKEYEERYGYENTLYPPEVLAHIAEGLETLRKAYVYAQRIDWLLSDDDDNESFLARLKEDLNELETDKKGNEQK